MTIEGFFFSAIAKVYFEEGNKEFVKEENYNAMYFYTEGIQVHCKDVQLNAYLHNNRAAAYFNLGKILCFRFFLLAHYLSL